MSQPARLAMLVSGSGSNLQAIIDACAAGRLPAQVVLVVSNRKDAYALVRATRAGIPTAYLPFKPYREAGRERAAYDADLAALVRAAAPDYVVLAGWLHSLSMAFLQHFPGRVVNLHPALPGEYPGLHAIERAYAAWRAGETDHAGVMVHLVPDEGIDDGPVLRAEAVPIHAGDTPADLEARVHAAEHRLLVEALGELLVSRSCHPEVCRGTSEP